MDWARARAGVEQAMKKESKRGGKVAQLQWNMWLAINMVYRQQITRRWETGLALGQVRPHILKYRTLELEWRRDDGKE